MFYKIHQHRHIHSLQKNGWYGSSLFCSIILKCMLNVLLSSHDQSECNGEIFSEGLRRLIQTYLYRFVEMILRVSIQCDMAEISLNRIL